MSDAPLPAIHPHTTMGEIAALCQQLSTKGQEVYARIEVIEGKPVVFLHRAARADSPFRRQAG